MTTVRIDPPTIRPGESRCVHDQIEFGQRSTCSICRGLPDVPVYDSSPLLDTPEPALRWLSAEQATECAACGVEIPRRDPIAYSRTHDGSICRACGEAA